MASSPINVLSLNCGSSSLKFGLYRSTADAASVLCEGEAEEIGSSDSRFWFRRSEGDNKHWNDCSVADHQSALHLALKTVEDTGLPRADAVGHRFVHGGPKLRHHQRVEADTLRELEAARSFAPLHMPSALAVLKEASARMPDLPQVVCLDTAFHQTMPEVSRRFALSEDVIELGVERFGFHGLSIESILAQMKTVPPRLVVAHLGNGCSVSAIEDGKSIDTTMGLTPTGGIMMGTRSGDLDPGVLLFLMNYGYSSAEQLSRLVDHQAGLLGVSGLTSDVRELISARAINPRVDLALRMFVYQVTKAIAAMAAALGGLDMLVFAGGIGENNQQLRDEVVSNLAFLGRFQEVVIPSREDQQIAKITARILAA